MAEDLAKAGFIAYVTDVRGYGRSTRQKEMSDPPEKHAPLVRSNEAVRDIDAAVDSIRNRTGQERISLLGWATGGQWAGYYAALHSNKLSHVVIHNALYGANTAQPSVGRGSDLDNPNHPGEFSVPTLVIASERDFWSRPEDRELLIAHLVHAQIKRLVIIPDATHFVHLDRNEHGRQQFLDEVSRFCRE